MQIILDNAIFIFVIALFGFVFYSMFSKRGKGMMLGGSIVESARDEISQTTGLLTTTIRAHVVEAKSGDKHVGLEISENAKLGASFKPLQLSKKEAETLIGMLNEVVSKT